MNDFDRYEITSKKDLYDLILNEIMTTRVRFFFDKEGIQSSRGEWNILYKFFSEKIRTYSIAFHGRRVQTYECTGRGNQRC